MASHVTQLYDKLVALCFAPAQANLGIQYVDLADFYRLGPELGARIQRMGPQNALPAVIVSPMTPEEDTANDAQQRQRRVVQPFNIAFVYKRSENEMRDVVEKYADPLHDLLCAEQVRRLGSLKLYDARKIQVGHVIGFDVGTVDLDPPENGVLYETTGGELACLTVRVVVAYVAARDSDTLTVRRHE